MGRLSEYINGSRGRTTYLDSATSSSGGNAGSYVQVNGFVENDEMFERLLTSSTTMDLNLRALIRKVLKEARKNLSNDARSYIKNDPRKAARAVKSSVYKQLFGGNLSILRKRKAGPKYQLVRHRKIDENPRQIGGNRRPVNSNTEAERLNKYYGSDRGFILRFLNAGTGNRQSRYGKRGSIRQTGWFEHTAPWQMETAAQNVAEAINELIKHETNG